MEIFLQVLDVFYADYNQILLRIYLQILQIISIHSCQNSQRKSLHQVRIWNLWNPRELLSSLETGKCGQGVYGEIGVTEEMDMDLAAHQKICSSAATK